MQKDGSCPYFRCNSILFLFYFTTYPDQPQMKKVFLIPLICFCFHQINAQTLKFTFSDSTFLPMKPTGQLHGVSAIEYVSSKKQWHLATDRGAYFVFDSIKTIRDFEKSEKTVMPKYTNFWFESVRFDQHNGRFFYAIENDYKPIWENTDTTTYVSYAESYPPKEAHPAYLIAPIPLPADNKGIESMAVTDSGNVWVAPEAGWAGETEVGNDTIHFLKFVKTNSIYQQPVSFSYVIDRGGCPNSTTEKRGGISEILSVNENQLLVLERCFDNGDGGTNRIKAKLWQVTVDGLNLKKDSEPAFDFNAGLPFQPDNLEGMAWWPSENGKRKLIVVTDDNPGLKNKQRTQLILLEEK